MPYRMSAHVERRSMLVAISGDATIVLEYQPHLKTPPPEHWSRSISRKGQAGSWTRSDGVRIAFNRVGGLARQPTPLCARDLRGKQALAAGT